MLWAYDKKLGRMHPSRVENTGGQGNFYSVRREDGELDHRIDEHFQTVESKAADPYDRLVRGEVLEGQARADFATFMATLYVRSPGMIRSTAEATGKMMQAFMNFQWNDQAAYDRSIDDAIAAGVMDPDVDRKKMYEFWKKKDFSISVLEQAGLMGLGAADPIQEILFNRNWFLLDSPGEKFITGDQAITIWNPPRPPFYSGGFADVESEVSFPLSPALCLLITDRDLGFHRTVVTSDAVWRLNEFRAMEAERMLWSSVRDNRILDLALKYPASRGRFKMSGEERLAKVKVKRSLS